MKIEFFFDVGSPYTFLASRQIDAVADALGVPVVWKPFLLGAVFKVTGNAAPALVPAKGKYMWKDLQRLAAKHETALTFPAAFPTNTILPQRAIVAAELRGDAEQAKQAARALFDAYWCRGEDIGQTEIAVAALNAAGLDGANLAEQASAADVKAQLRANGDDAVARGAFGAPTFFVGDEMFFGVDRIEWMADHIRASK